MGKVVIRCPRTARVVETGWTMPPRVLRQSVAFAAVLQSCPACAQSHEWTPDDAWVIELRAPEVTACDRPQTGLPGRETVPPRWPETWRGSPIRSGAAARTRSQASPQVEPE